MPSGLWKFGMTITALTSFCVDGVAQFVEADALARRGRDLERAEVEALDDFEETEVGGRLDRDGVAGLGDGAQAEVERLGAAGGDDEFVVRERHAGLQVAPGDLAGERLVAAVHAGAADQRGIAAGDGAEDARELLGGEKAVVRAGRAEGHVVGLEGELQDLGGEIVDADVGRLGHGLGHARLRARNWADAAGRSSPTAAAPRGSRGFPARCRPGARSRC